jgi:hypothetical protein
MDVMFWHMQLHPGGEEEEYSPAKIKEILKKHQVIGFDIWDKAAGNMYDKPFTDWTEEDIQNAIEKSKTLGENVGTFGIILPFRDEMKIGDIVLIRKGAKPIALVEVISDYFMDTTKDEDGEPWFRHRRKVKILGFFDEDKEKLGLSWDSWPSPRGTLQRLIDPQSQSYRYLEEWVLKKKESLR